MTVSVRLSRHGTRNRPFYHVVATHKRMARDSGRMIEKLGTYDPGLEPSLIELKEERIRDWFEKGAEVSPAVTQLLKIKNIKLARKNTAKKK